MTTSFANIAIERLCAAVVQDESDLDDEAMFKLDVKLAAAFRSLKKGTKLDRGKVVQLKHYKMRQVSSKATFSK